MLDQNKITDTDSLSQRPYTFNTLFLGWILPMVVSLAELTGPNMKTKEPQ